MQFPGNGGMMSLGISGPWLSLALTSLTVLSCDFGETIEEDVRLVLEYPISFPIFVYWITRLSTLGYFIGVFAFFLDPYSSTGIELTTWSLLIQRVSSSLLLYIRVLALYRSNRYVQTFFACYLGGIVASHISITLALLTSGYGSDFSCYDRQRLTPGILLGFDSCIVAAVVYKIKVGYWQDPDRQKRWWLWDVFYFQSNLRLDHFQVSSLRTASLSQSFSPVFNLLPPSCLYLASEFKL
ncbi:hypothetical protein CPB83DRAFT_244896 [Crepidotus variabilis]|uniref:Uncharacterized protein n=1 Tax=Crepidotus variabilis TaxID=179855 RepID=A0A9P6EJ17_9AGAR|nr:hypothetical protein CPB83DRAFT_244896 [Crepidotus variabilis]